MKRFWLLVSVFLLISFCGSPAIVQAEASFHDVENHWAATEIESWVEQGLIAGYADGTFKPEQAITRAEFVALLNRAFGYREMATVPFSDVVPEDWFATEIAKAHCIGYLGGYPDGTVQPNNSISRQEVAALFTKILKTKTTQFNALTEFVDYEQIPEWSFLSISGMVNKGYMGGYPDHTFQPARSITRAEAVVVLARVVGALYNEAGVYVTETPLKNVTINTPEITLKDAIINGDLYLTEGLANGTVTLDNVEVKGATLIKGGGSNSMIQVSKAPNNILNFCLKNSTKTP